MMLILIECSSILSPLQLANQVGIIYVILYRVGYWIVQSKHSLPQTPFF